MIDADNVASQSRDGQQGVFTPDYGAPEILKGESGINTLTDSWSFAVMAYRILTLVHPLKGGVVLEGEPEREEAALRFYLLASRACARSLPVLMRVWGLRVVAGKLL